MIDDATAAEVEALNAEADALEALARAKRARATVLEARLGVTDDGERLVGAKEMGVPSPQWRRAIRDRDGELPGAKFGRVFLARRADAIKWIESKVGKASASSAPVDVVDLDRERLARGGAIDLGDDGEADGAVPRAAGGA